MGFWEIYILVPSSIPRTRIFQFSIYFCMHIVVLGIQYEFFISRSSRNHFLNFHNWSCELLPKICMLNGTMSMWIGVIKKKCHPIVLRDTVWENRTIQQNWLSLIDLKCFFFWKLLSSLVIWQIFRIFGHSLVDIQGFEGTFNH